MRHVNCEARKIVFGSTQLVPQRTNDITTDKRRHRTQIRTGLAVDLQEISTSIRIFPQRLVGKLIARYGAAECKNRISLVNTWRGWIIVTLFFKYYCKIFTFEIFHDGRIE